MATLSELDLIACDELVQPKRLWTIAEIRSGITSIPDEAGVYAWYFRESLPRVPLAGCHWQREFSLLYVGISPSEPAAGKPLGRQRLRQRLGNHMFGNAEGSTLRFSLGCLLADELGIELRRVGGGKRFTFAEGEKRLSEWMEQNTRLVWTVCEEPWKLEAKMIATMSLPLNLDQNPHPFTSTLGALRKTAKCRAKLLPVLANPSGGSRTKTRADGATEPANAEMSAIARPTTILPSSSATRARRTGKLHRSVPITPDERFRHLTRFYSLLGQLERSIGGARPLGQCSESMAWPERGVFFFSEPGEMRSNTGDGLRITYVGTLGLKSGSRASLWTRLSQHKGQIDGRGGNHRGSVLRLLIGTALMCRDGFVCPSWGSKDSAAGAERVAESALEIEVSKVVGDMPVLWLPLDDQAEPKSGRKSIKRNSIALLSNFERSAVDPPSHNWLGRYCDRERVRESGLWNSIHVDEEYDPDFLDEVERLVVAAAGGSAA